MVSPDITSLSQAIVHIATMSWAIIVSITATTLFWTTYKKEQAINTPWRAIGFGLLVLSFTLSIIGRFFPVALYGALVLEVAAFTAIWYGVSRDLTVTHLREDPAYRKKFSKAPIGFIFGVASTVALSIFVYLTSSVLILATIPLQIRRYALERKSPRARLQNLYPLAAYLFLLLRSVFLLWFIFQPQAIALWYLAMIATNVAFILLAVWAWIFIRVRKQLRMPVAIILIGAITASAAFFLATLIFLTFIRSL